MKRILIIAAAALATMQAYGQKANVNAAENAMILQQYDKAKESIDEALANEKTKDYAKTYIVAAKVYAHAIASDVANAAKAKEFIKEAQRLNEQGDNKGKGIGKFTKDLEKAYSEVATAAEVVAGTAYNEKNFNASKEAFIFDLWVSSQKANYDELADSLIITNVGIASMQAEDWETGSEYFLKAGRLKIGGPMSYLRAKYCFEQLGDSVNIEKTLKEGFEAYPAETDMINTLINYYIQAGKNEEALVYLNNAIERDPNSAQYYFARGCLKERSDVEAAKADYVKAISLDPSNFGATYNIAVVYYNDALNLKTAASGELDNVKYNAMMQESNGLLEKAVPYFKKAAEIAPDYTQKREVLTNLQRTYYTLQMYTESQQVKAQIDQLDDEQQQKQQQQ